MNYVKKTSWLYSNKDRSDKVYILQCVWRNRKYTVESWYGRRGQKLNCKSKGFNDYDSAMIEYGRLCAQKLAKGYDRIEDIDAYTRNSVLHFYGSDFTYAENVEMLEPVSSVLKRLKGAYGSK